MVDDWVMDHSSAVHSHFSLVCCFGRASSLVENVCDYVLHSVYLYSTCTEYGIQFPVASY